MITMSRRFEFLVQEEEMGVLAFVCPATGKSVFTDLEIDQSIYSSILKNRLSHMHCSECGEPHQLSEVVSWLADISDTPTEQ
jgi:hypothetical protein